MKNNYYLILARATIVQWYNLVQCTKFYGFKTHFRQSYDLYAWDWDSYYDFCSGKKLVPNKISGQRLSTRQRKPKKEPINMNPFLGLVRLIVSQIHQTTLSPRIARNQKKINVKTLKRFFFFFDIQISIVQELKKKKNSHSRTMITYGGWLGDIFGRENSLHLLFWQERTVTNGLFQSCNNLVYMP